MAVKARQDWMFDVSGPDGRIAMLESMLGESLLYSTADHVVFCMVKDRMRFEAYINTRRTVQVLSM